MFHIPDQTPPKNLIPQAISAIWPIEAYAKRYGPRAASAMEACRKAARKGDQKELQKAAKKLSLALYTVEGFLK